MASDLLNEKEALERLPISRSELYRERSRGNIAFHKFGRRVFYKMQDIEKYIGRHRRGA